MSLRLPNSARQLASRPLTWRAAAGEAQQVTPAAIQPAQPAHQTRLSLRRPGEKTQIWGHRTILGRPMTGLGTCPGSQEARASLQLVLGARTQGLGREVHDHHGSRAPEERVLEGINTQNAQDGARRGSRNQVISGRQLRPFQEHRLLCADQASLPGSRLGGRRD